MTPSLVATDPDMSSLPETYFLDIHDKSDEDLSDSECHQPTPNGRTRTDSGSFRYTALPSSQRSVIMAPLFVEYICSWSVVVCI